MASDKGVNPPEVYKRKDGLWDWRLKADNGQVIATSGGQGYTERNDAQEAADRLFPKETTSGKTA